MRVMSFTGLIILLAGFAFPLLAGDIKIGLFNRTPVESMVFTTIEGEYLLTGDGKQVAVIRKGSIFHIDHTGSGIEVHDTLQSYGSFSTLVFKGTSGSNLFLVKPVFPALTSKESEDDLLVSIYNEHLQLINTIDLEKYIPGTVESEGGSGALPEFYKAQAVITRTFALRNFHRHAHEGFNLCDDVHCQAFNGKSRMNKEIYNATRCTENEILSGLNGEPVITAYHANCGGITGSASLVWNRDLFYLTPVHDPFCNKSSHSSWKKSVMLSTWNEYLYKKNYAGNSDDLTSADSGRQKYLDMAEQKLLLTEIREEFNLKSSYFFIEKGNESIIFHGHGYGHGLGLCQQGAIEMARVGYTYVDILMFYFTGLKLIKR